jgi:MraZ protein
VKRKFRGEYTQKVDGKGRVSIPAKFCRALESSDPDWSEGKPATLFLVFGDKRRAFAEGYSAESMAEIEAGISALPRGTPRRLALEKAFFRQSDEVLVDGTGRIVLPRPVREKIGLLDEGEAVFCATGDRFQIWNARDFHAQDSGDDPADAVLDALGDDRDITELLNDGWNAS